MMALRERLSSIGAVAATRRGGDVRQYQDFMSGQPTHCFEPYVEADTRAGETFVWLLDITLLGSQWSVDRTIARQTADGPEDVREFGQATFQSIDQLVDGFPALAAEFFDSAKTIAFDN